MQKAGRKVLRKMFIPDSEFSFKENLRNFFMVSVGVMVMTVGLHFFLIPQDLAVGGVTGMAQVIEHYIPSLSLATPIFIANIILFAIGFIFFGREFGGLTIYAAFFLNGCIAFCEKFFPMNGTPMVPNDVFINLAFGIIIQGVGMGLIFYYNASTGGTDIIAKVINKFLKIDIGKALFLSDALVVTAATFAFGVRLGLYAFLGILVNALVIDKIIAGFNNKLKVFVTSKDYEKIREFVINDLDRSCTLLHATGGYTNEEQRLVVVILSKREFLRLKWFLKKHAPGSFLSVNLVHEVIGNGFGFDK